MENLKNKLEAYNQWSISQDWYQPETGAVTINDSPGADEIQLIEERFGELPASYKSILEEFGLSSFTYDCYESRMLSPDEVIELYEVVQAEASFSDELMEMLLEEGVDLTKYIPVMAGAGTDGRWVLLNITDDKGKVLLWDTDQPADVESVYTNLEEFIRTSIEAAMENNPIRLT
jgi:hypothetical protein